MKKKMRNLQKSRATHFGVLRIGIASVVLLLQVALAASDSSSAVLQHPTTKSKSISTSIHSKDDAIPSLFWKTNPSFSVRGGAITQNKSRNVAVVVSQKKTKIAASQEGASIRTSVFNLANNVAGAGILTLAAGKASGTGWIPSILICLAIATVSSHTFSLVGKSCELTGLDSFKDLWSYAFGSSETAWVVDTMVFVQCFFVSIIYTGLLGDVFSALLKGTLGIDAWWTSRTSVILLAAANILFPLNLIRDLSSLGFTSVLGLIAVLYTVGFIVLRAVDGTYGIGSGIPVVDGGKAFGKFVAEGLLPKIPSFAKSTLWNVDLNSLVLISNLGLAFIAHYNAPSYWRSLGNSASSKKFEIISKRAYLILAAIYTTTMVSGYATFGDASMGNILLNYSSTDLLATLGRLATGLSIIFGFPLISNGCREGFKNAADALGLFGGAASDPKNHAKLVICLLLVTTTLAIVADDIGMVAGLTGALMGSSLVYICPTLLYAKIVGRKSGFDSEEYKAAKKNLVWIPFGIFTASMGIIMTLKNSMSTDRV